MLKETTNDPVFNLSSSSVSEPTLDTQVGRRYYVIIEGLMPLANA